MKEGIGAYKWPNGSTYVGQWARNMINGVVRFYSLIFCRESKSGVMAEDMKVNSRIIL